MTFADQPHLNGMAPAPDAVRLTLLPDQLAARNELVARWRDREQATMIYAPTGAGKTAVATELMRSAFEAGSEAYFVADQVQLVDQAVRTFRRYGLTVGITQGENYGNYHQLVVASAQTLAREYRRPANPPKLIIIDEAHVQYVEVLKWAQSTGARLVGLSATPLAAGLGRWYQSVINVVTTNELIEQGRLVPMTAFLEPIQIDHEGVERNRYGAYDVNELARRTTKVTGDVVTQWVKRKNQIFGPGAKVPTVVFTNTIADGAAYAAEFQKAGYDFRQTTYEARSRSMRGEILDMFERQEIDGIVNCLALAKGWDSSTVMCIIDLQSNGSSVMPVAQKYGRGMRIHADIDADGAIHHKPVNAGIERKDKFLLLDHVGNTTGWAEELDMLYSVGVTDLTQSRKQYATKRREPDERDPNLTCEGCDFLLPKGAAACPMCGRERGRRILSRPASKPGELEEGSVAHIAKTRRGSKRKRIQTKFGGRELDLWLEICNHTDMRAQSGTPSRWKENRGGHRWWAGKQFENLMGHEVPREWVYRPNAVECSEEVADAIAAQIKSYMIKQSKGKKAK